MCVLNPSFRALFALAVCLTCPGLARAGFVINGGFETGDFTGWTQSANTNDSGVTTGIAHGGNYAAYFGPAETMGFLSQNLATTAGTRYLLSFYLKSDGSVPNSLQLTFGEATFDLANLPAFDYTRETFAVTATSSSTLLQFGFRNDGGNFFLDDVAVDAVPEPASLVTMAQGGALIGLGLVARARRRRPARVFAGATGRTSSANRIVTTKGSRRPT